MGNVKTKIASCPKFTGLVEWTICQMNNHCVTNIAMFMQTTFYITNFAAQILYSSKVRTN